MPTKEKVEIPVQRQIKMNKGYAENLEKSNSPFKNLREHSSLHLLDKLSSHDIFFGFMTKTW